jgi:glycosyltransferase involved in cell wall biosynthesis
MPRIAVVTPSLNQRAFVGETLRSVLDQGYPELEYVVVDGGSTDGSVDAIREHEGRLAWWVSEPDRGHPDAINKGFAHTNGEIMCWINSSDAYYPWTFVTVAQIFEQLPEVEWIMGIPSEFGLSGGPKKVAPAFVNVYDFLAARYRWIQQESVFWRRGLWERAGGELDEDKPRVADFDLWLRFLRLTPLYHVETVLGGFRNHDDRLGDQTDGRYESEAMALLPSFAASLDGRTRRRGRIVRAVGSDRRKLVGQTLHRMGVWPWYRHPRVGFDFTRGRWVVQ